MDPGHGDEPWLDGRPFATAAADAAGIAGLDVRSLDDPECPRCIRLRGLVLAPELDRRPVAIRPSASSGPGRRG